MIKRMSAVSNVTMKFKQYCHYMFTKTKLFQSVSYNQVLFKSYCFSVMFVKN